MVGKLVSDDDAALSASPAEFRPEKMSSPERWDGGFCEIFVLRFGNQNHFVHFVL